MFSIMKIELWIFYDVFSELAFHCHFTVEDFKNHNTPVTFKILKGFFYTHNE